MKKEQFAKYLKSLDGDVVDICEKIGISYGTYYNILNGKGVCNRTLQRINEFAKGKRKKKRKSGYLNIEDVWKYIHPKIKCICQDSNGDIYGYETTNVKPNIEEGVWQQEGGECYAVCLLIDFSEFKDWKQRKYTREVSYDDYIGMYGLFSSDEKYCLSVFGILESVNLKSKSPFKCKGRFDYKYFRPLTVEEKGKLC